MTDRELMQQALDFLVGGDFAYPTKLATDLRDRLAQPEQEPVAWIQPNHLQKAMQAPFLCRVEPNKRMADFVGIYTAPPQRKPLTVEEVKKLIHPIVMADLSDEMTDFEIVRAIEAAHGIKENT